MQKEATKLNVQVYKCNKCGNIVEVLHKGGGTLVCCGEPMMLLEEKTQLKEGKEKHVPVVETKGDKILVKVGSVAHPMEEKHYIEWIEVITSDGRIFRKYLSPGNPPEAEFPVSAKNVAIVREYCNLHGLWKA